MDNSLSTVQAQQPAKFSRYRSVRKAAAANAQSTNPTSPPPLPATFSQSTPGISSSQNESIKRSMSRYRHAKPTKIVTSIPPPPLPTIPAHNNQQYSHIENWIDTTTKNQDLPRFRAHSLEQGHELPPSPFSGSPRNSLSQPTSPRFGTFARILGKDSTDRHHRKEELSPPSSSGEGYAMFSREPYISPRDDRTGRGPLESSQTPTSPLQHEGDTTPVDVIIQNTREELLANARAAAIHNRPSTAKKLVKERGGLLSRIKGIDPSGSSRDTREDLKTLISSPKLIDPKDLMSALPDDTPVSAVNAGERKVLVTCNDSFISLPITPTTKAQDLLYSAANCLSEEINPKTAVLMESFKQLGLQRPLRRYEHVRDVMNSWDDDTQNHLDIITDPDDEMTQGLDVRSAPRKHPKDATFHIYHCQRQGKWDKRYITLRSDGQVLMAKKPGAETTNICHLSDFDIYCPKKREYRRIKPPKKLCFVVKSQEKASMFLTSDNFAHFFSMSDSDTGWQWYNAVQSWRSWYLVSIMGEGTKKDRPETRAGEKGASKTYTNRFSTGSIPYQLGTFSPLVDMEALADEIVARPPSTPPSDDVPLNDLKLASPNSKPTPINSYSNTPLASAPSSPKRSHVLPDRVTVQKRGRSRTTASKKPSATEEEPFMATGLLGRTYTMRQHAMREREKEVAEATENFAPFAAHGLLNHLEKPSRSIDRSGYMSSSGPPSREGTIRSPPARNRAKSIQQPHKPLIDLTPTYQEPVHHARKGRGVAAQPGTKLVDNATGPELCPGAIVIPSATTWRKPSSSQQRSGTMSSQTSRAPELFSPRVRQRSATMRSTHYSAAAAAAAAASVTATPQSPSEMPFIPTGLLAQGKFNHAQGSAQTGRGVATGNRNASGQPLVDLSEPSLFPGGTLLRSVEHQRVETG